MIVLGLIDSKPSAAALMIDNKIVAAVAEERLCRMKLASGLPRAAIAYVMEAAGLTAADIDQVAVAQRACVFEPEPIPWSGWFKGQEILKTYRFDNLSSKLAPLLGRFPPIWHVHHQFKRLRSQERIRELPRLLKQAYGIESPVNYYDHHYCHATTAYYNSGFEQALVVTLDGGGDGRSGSVYVGENGQLRQLASVDSFNSLGNFYSYVTELCGFRAEKDEGKITGLAAVGKPIYAEVLRQFIQYKEPGQIRYLVPMYYRSALRLLAERLPVDFERADLAASVQLVLEEVGTQFVRFWLNKTGLRNLAVAGGVFANVKFNQRIHELSEVENIFIHPAMDDGGLCVGSALAGLAEQRNVDSRELIRPLTHVYLGNSYSDLEIESVVKASSYQAQYLPNIHMLIAHLLADGQVVARFTGAMEFGPRALGHRSILYQTNDVSVNEWLNAKLQRTEFMPFAPATLAEFASERYVGIAGAANPARFMTITFDCTELMKRESPGVVHVDGTARPQLIDAKTAPDFDKILQAYYQLTGIPSLINTSFNMHGEPIVCSPADAMRSFEAGNLDYLAIGNWLVTHPSLTSLRRTTEIFQQA